jgi:hypothetical protein
MARLRAVVTTEGEIASGTSAKTLLQLVAAANHKVAVKGFSISMDGTSVTAEPVQVDLLRQTSGGSMTSATPVAEDSSSETIQTTAQKNASSEPTGGNVIRRYNVHPQTGLEVRFNADDEILIPGGGRLGLRVTAAATVNCLAHVTFEE